MPRCAARPVGLHPQRSRRHGLRPIGAGLLACILLTGCGGDDDQPPPSAPVALSEPAPTAVPAPPSPPPSPSVSADLLVPVWDAARTPDGMRLTLVDQGRGPAVVLRMTCRPDRGFTVESQSLTPVGGEARLTLSAGAATVSLAAAAMPDGTGVQATGPIDTRLLGGVAVGLPLEVGYGAQALGPLRAAARPLLARFVLACRNYAR